MKLAIIADGHHFQSFIKNYDSLHDLKMILQKIKKENSPDALLMAGDMFDFKKTSTAYLRHYEGEGLMIRVRNILRSFGLPVYAIRGNHEKEEVLRGIEQTVENFHYVKNDWKKFDDTSIYFMDTNYEGGLYEPELVSKIVEQISSTADKTDETRILICHETFAPFDNCLPKKAIEDATKNFDCIINGHMHFWNRSAYELNNVITLPSACMHACAYAYQKAEKAAQEILPPSKEVALLFDSPRSFDKFRIIRAASRLFNIDLEVEERGMSPE